MKKYLLLPVLVLSLFVWTGCSDDDNGGDKKETVTISFDSKLTEPNSEFKATGGKPLEYGYFETSFTDPSDVLEYNHYYSESYGFGGGFTYTNKSDITTPTYENISSITGKSKEGTTYITCYYNDYYSIPQITQLKPETYKFKGTWITNSTYGYYVIKDGNSYSVAFKDGDWFKLIIKGYDGTNKEIGRIDNIYLADYRDGKTNIIKEWTWIDFTSLSEAEYLTFEFDSNVTNDQGITAPTYFCMDRLTLEKR